VGSRRTVRWQLRALVTGICALMLAGGGMTVFVLQAQNAQIERVTTLIGPARDANTKLLQAATDAEQALTDVVTRRQPESLAALADARARVEALQPRMRSLLGDQNLGADRYEYGRLLARQDGALSAWTYYADRAVSGAAAGEPADADTIARLFGRFRAAHEALAAKLNAARDAMRSTIRQIIPEASLVVLAVTALVLFGVGFLARRAARSLTEPITQLRLVAQRIRAGQAVRADERAGAGEVRELAVAFNALTAHNAELVAEHAEVLRLHQTALAAERAIRESSTAAEAIDVVCDLVGPEIRTDRLVVSLVDEKGLVTRAAQWHAAGLPDFPPDVSPYAGPLAARLWQNAGHLSISDIHAADGEREAWVAEFVREAGARSLLVVPIGLGDNALGVISVADAHGPRGWRTAEITLLHHVASSLAHLIAAVSHRDRQAAYVADLERLDQQKDDFLSTVSHELRTPLASIIGYLELLEDEPVGAEPRVLLDVVERNTVRLRSLVEDLLSVNRMTVGRSTEPAGSERGGGPGLRAVPVPALVEQTVEELRPLADRGEVRLELRAGEGPALVDGTRADLQRAVVNVVANAIKFTPPRGTVRVAHHVDPDSGEVVITCADTGIGIPRADLDLLVTRFFRARNVANYAIPGTGLGLAIVQAVVDAHDGDLAFDSTEGKGTTVTLRFPPAGRRSSTVHTG